MLFALLGSPQRCSHAGDLWYLEDKQRLAVPLDRNALGSHEAVNATFLTMSCEPFSVTVTFLREGQEGGKQISLGPAKSGWEAALYPHIR